MMFSSHHVVEQFDQNIKQPKKLKDEMHSNCGSDNIPDRTVDQNETNDCVVVPPTLIAFRVARHGCMMDIQMYENNDKKYPTKILH